MRLQNVQSCLFDIELSVLGSIFDNWICKPDSVCNRFLYLFSARIPIESFFPNMCMSWKNASTVLRDRFCEFPYHPL